MGIVSGLVLFAVIWFMVLFVVLPLRLRTQGEDGNVVPGTPESAPVEARIGPKMRLVTLISVAIWAVVAAVILGDLVTLADIDIFGTLGPGFHDR